MLNSVDGVTLQANPNKELIVGAVRHLLELRKKTEPGSAAEKRLTRALEALCQPAVEDGPFGVEDLWFEVIGEQKSGNGIYVVTTRSV